MPLMEKGGEEIEEEKTLRPSVENGILPDFKGLYKHQQPEIDAVLISHAHIDHYGLLNYLHPSIPVYLSNGSYTLIKIGNTFYPAKSKIYFDNYKTFEHWKPFEIGPFRITSYLSDHSCYDASMFLIETENKKIFYSGDFRGHGRKAKLIESLEKNPIKDIDCLLLEGTTLGSNHNIGFDSEEEVEKELHQIFVNQKDVTFIMASGSNIDRLVSIYKATRNCDKTLVLDLYTYYVLDQLKKITPSLPPHSGDNIRILYLSYHAKSIADNIDKTILYKIKSRKIEIEEIINRRKEMVLKLPLSAMKKISKELVKTQSLTDSKFIYSMWAGYLERDAGFYNFCNEYQIKLLKIHTSGHAYLQDLKRISNALNPKMLLPIHTLSGDDYHNHFNNVVRVDDGMTVNV